ncbi:ribosome-binding protein 1 isoform X2 [Spea bombifrons]|uniref:ribosome-binding protein 1 isoform X2 n=1 Tax=Spea bombifrons TaxID=233779 RepID=UPI00234AD98D|nr:ribosome-binding protein 1 isoform X2 [Spea bombifrons]
MDLYDPQTIGVVVFGSFMVISAIGIVLVSTFSMKETSYEEALAKQRKEQEKGLQPKTDKKKKDKINEKKGKSKKKDDKPNGKLPEHETSQDIVEQKKAEVQPEVVVEEKPVRDAPIAPVVVPAPASAPALAQASAPIPSPEKAASSPKDKKKKQEKKVQKVEPSQNPAVVVAQAPISKATVSKTAASKPAPVLEVSAKEVPVVAVPPVGSKPSPPVTNSIPPKKAEAVVSHEESKNDAAPKKKNVSKKKSETVVNELDSAIYLPYKTLVSTISSMVFSEGEAQRLIEILTEKNGIKQGTWHTATQKGDPVTALKKQLEEKEKQLSAEQEDAAAAKNKLRELNKELAAEKAKVVSVEAKSKEQLLSKDKEITAVQARMQASYQDHIKEVQQLQGKIRTLQEEIENGPKAQLARLQQENSILRDALNQATSQTESKQNAELAKLRQECSKLTKELAEKNDSFQQEEQRRKNQDSKVAAYEKQVSQLQTLQQESEATLQKRLDEVNEELRKSQSSYKNLLSDSEKAKEQQKNFADLQTKLTSYEAEDKQKSEELDKLNKKLQEVTGENVQLNERIKSIEALLEAGQSKDTEAEKQQQETKSAEIEQLQDRLHRSDAQISSLEKEITELKDAVEQQKNKNNDLREKNWQAMEALGQAEKTWEEKLNAEKKVKEDTAQHLREIQTQTKETLLSLFPQVTVESQQAYNEWLQEFREKTSGILSQQSEKSSSSSELSLKLKEAEEAHTTLQAECEQYRTILAETEGMLKDLQKSVEQEEQVWKAKLTESEEELRKSHIQVKSLEVVVEKLKLDLQSTDQLKECISLMEAQLETQMNSASSECQNYSKEVESLQQLLSESQTQLESTKAEARKQSNELSLLRQQLREMQNHVQEREAIVIAEHQTKQKVEVPQLTLEEQIAEQNISYELEQKSVLSLQQELEKLKSAGETASGAEEAQQLKEEENDSNKGTSV